MADETQNQLPVDTTLSGQQSVALNSLKAYTEDLKNNALVAINAVNAKKAEGTIQLPQLEETIQTGYTKGAATTIVCCTIGRFFVEKNTAYDYLMMAAAAAKNGITLQLASGFRSMEQQQRLYTERSNPAVAAVLGVAARPGYSNHQSGLALDINVKMTKAMYKATPPQFTPEYLWLDNNAAAYGFDHVEGHNVSEPWHWTHLKREIVGSAAFYEATGFLELTTETALAAANINQAGTTRAVHQAAHDLTVSMARSSTMGKATRATFHKELAAFAANQSNGISSYVGQYQAATIEAEPAEFKATSLDAFSYNFETGKWEDGDAV